MGIKWPHVEQLTQVVETIQSELEDVIDGIEVPYVDVRLSVTEDGRSSIEYGRDLESNFKHYKFRGTSFVTKFSDCEEVASKILEGAKSEYSATRRNDK